MSGGFAFLYSGYFERLRSEEPDWGLPNLHRIGVEGCLGVELGV